LHHATRDADGRFLQTDELINVDDEPGHDELCRREQMVFLHAIRDDVSLGEHWQTATDSLRIVLAADQSFRERRTVNL
jgi:hypothetical protein